MATLLFNSQEEAIKQLFHQEGTYILVTHIYHNSVYAFPAHGEVYSIQHYVIKFVSDLQQIVGFLRVL